MILKPIDSLIISVSHSNILTTILIFSSLKANTLFKKNKKFERSRFNNIFQKRELSKTLKKSKEKYLNLLC